MNYLLSTRSSWRQVEMELTPELVQRYGKPESTVKVIRCNPETGKFEVMTVKRVSDEWVANWIVIRVISLGELDALEEIGRRMQDEESRQLFDLLNKAYPK